MQVATQMARAARRVPMLNQLLDERRRAQAEAARLQLRNAHLQRELRDLRRRDPGARDDLGYVFIVTYGRSGSTLLQGILNSIPGYLLRGENNAMLEPLYRYHRKSVNARKKFNRPDALPPWHAWYGIDGYPDASAYRDMRGLFVDTVLRPEPDTRVTGFKEIRWLSTGLPEYVEFIRAVFPGARFIINTRNLEDVRHSKWWAEDPDAMNKLRRFEDNFLSLHDKLGPASYRVHYDDYVDDPIQLHGLFDWLGEDFDEKRIRTTMQRSHSY